MIAVHSKHVVLGYTKYGPRIHVLTLDDREVTACANRSMLLVMFGLWCRALKLSGFTIESGRGCVIIYFENKIFNI